MSQIDSRAEEQRDFRRMQVAAPVRFRPVGSDAPLQAGVARNLSATGILFETAQAVAVGDELELEVQPGSERLPPLRGRLKVLRVEQGEGGYLVGGELSDIS